MNCEHAHRVLDAYLDGELDDATHAQVHEHLAGCPACKGLLDERDALRAGLQRLPRHDIPLRLRQSVSRALAHDGGAAPMAPGRAGRRHVAVWAGAAAALAFVMGFWAATPAPVRDLREQVIARHVASFERGTPQVGVPSTDRHVVKPWFAGKLDFAPPVRELSGDGFVLVGGRIDALDGRPTAVVVYRIRQHQISLFVSRSLGETSKPVMVSTLRGFAIATWSHDGLAHWAVSDVEARDLQRFSDLVQAPTP